MKKNVSRINVSPEGLPKSSLSVILIFSYVNFRDYDVIVMQLSIHPMLTN